MFIFGIGTPFKRLEKFLGRDEKMLDKIRQQLDTERETGKRPPFRGGMPEHLSTSDPMLDRIIRGILVRRAKMREMDQRRERAIQPRQPAKDE